LLTPASRMSCIARMNSAPDSVLHSSAASRAASGLASTLNSHSLIRTDFGIVFGSSGAALCRSSRAPARSVARGPRTLRPRPAPAEDAPAARARSRRGAGSPEAMVEGMGDGDGWAGCGLGHTHWGRFGAAGLLPYHRDSDGQVWVLLQQRAWWGIGGGTWGMFGGALHSHEDPVAGALRETSEECTLDTGAVKVHGTSVEDHGRWSFTSVVGSLSELTPVRPASRETRRAGWVRAAGVTRPTLVTPLPLSELPPVRSASRETRRAEWDRAGDVTRRKLFEPFARSWPRLREAMKGVTLVVDAANVVGARADGWWKDRAGANARLRDELKA